MPGSPLTGQGGQFGGPQYGWGSVPNQPGAGARSGSAGARTNFNSGFTGGAYNTSPEAGLHRGEWQYRGHGPSAQQSYGWDYQGGVGRDEITQRTDARMGSSFQARMAQERSGGLPGGNYAIDYDRGQRTGGGRDVSYDWGWEGHGAGMQGGGMQGGGMQRGGMGPRYGGDYRGGTSGGFGYAGGNPQPRGGYGRDFGAGYGQERGGHVGGMRAGGYGARGYDRGMRRAMGGGYGGRYGGEYQQPLSDAEFYRRVDRW